MSSPANLIVIDDDDRIYYSAERVKKNQVVTVIDLFNRFTDSKSKAFMAKVKKVDDQEIEFYPDSIKELKLFVHSNSKDQTNIVEIPMDK